MEPLQQDVSRPPRRDRPLRRFALVAGLSIAGTVTVVAFLRLILVPCLVFLIPQLEVAFLDWGLYGAFPERWYNSFDLPSPRSNTVHWSDSCSDALVLLSLSGPGVEYKAPLVLNAEGELVWTTGEFPASANLKVQQYNGENHLTFWAGEKLLESGLGMYYIMDSSYNVVQSLSAVGDDLDGDLHEFKITENDTALIIAYNNTHLDTAGRDLDWIEDDFIIDGVVQEIDIATRELLFQWKGSDYLERPSFRTSYGSHATEGALDYFHINSVDKDSAGNYLISIRHLHTIVYVDGQDGHIIWALGGATNHFNDSSRSGVTDFKWQHDVRWVDREQGIISLFDNGIARGHYSDSDESEGRILRLDFEERTVELVQSFRSPTAISSVSQGSVQMLPPGEDGDQHVFIGWGSSAAYSEFTSDGQLLCESHFAASALFYYERAKSYRATKAPTDWRAEPENWNPAAKYSGGEMYVSWNGATEVAFWTLQGQSAAISDAQEEAFEDLDTVPKQGFETTIDLPKGADGYNSYRVAALDADMQFLRHSNIEQVSKSNKTVYLSVTAMLAVAALVTVCLLRYRAFIEQKLAFWRPRIAYHKLGGTT